jgi:hypothetical protein
MPIVLKDGDRAVAVIRVQTEADILAAQLLAVYRFIGKSLSRFIAIMSIADSRPG